MEYTPMEELAYRQLDNEEYEARRASILDMAEHLPEDATEEQMRSLDLEMDVISAEDTRRQKVAEVRATKRAAVASGEGAVVTRTEIQKEESEVEYRSLGEFAAKNLDLSGVESGLRAGTTWMETRAATDTHTAPTINVLDREPVNLMPFQFGIRDLLASEAISGNSLTYYTMGNMEGTIGVVAEDALKPQVHFPNTETTVALSVIAAWWYESNQLLEDAPFLASAIDSRGRYYFRQQVESFLATGILGTSGIQTISAAPSIDNILTAKNNVMQATGFAADGIVLNPADLTAFQLERDGGQTGQYLFGGPAYAPYGNGRYSNVVTMWGLPVVASSAVASGTAIVGAFQMGGSVVTKAGEGQRVELFREDGDNVRYNRVTVRIEERLALAMRVPGAFVKIKA